MKWTQPVYAAQVLTGTAGVGAILIADQLTRWHILVSVLLASAVVTSLIVTARAEADAQRNRANMDTLLRAMELPYFITKAVSRNVKSIAKSHGWVVTRQENFAQETLYELEAGDGQHGQLLVSAQEFKDLWILEEEARHAAIERRLFGPDSDTPAGTIEENVAAVVRQVIAEFVAGPHWVKQVVHPDGSREYEVRRTQTESPLATVRFSTARFQHLLRIGLPIQRYHHVAEDVRHRLRQGGRDSRS